MSKLSIYDRGWIDLVFEGKNKEYGAYQLRRQSDRTTVIAFFGGLIFISGVYLIANLLGVNKTQITIPQTLDDIITVSSYKPFEPPKTKTVVPVTKQTKEPTEEKTLTDPIIVKAPVADSNIAKPKDNTSTTTTSGTEGSTTATTATASGTGGATQTVAAPVGSETISIISVLDKMPEFPGGIDKFYSYVGRNFNNPDTGEPKTMRVYVSFVIEKDGSMTDIQVKRDPGYGLGKEAIRVLKSLKTKWEPGLIDGKPVRTAYNLPITVKIE